jgi:hypothetical protein
MDIKQMANVCIGKNGNNYSLSENSDSITEFWRIERSFTNSGNIQESTDNYLLERKDSIREFEISPNSTNFYVCDLWDMVRVYINSWNDLMFYDGAIKVIEKSYTAGEMAKVTFKLWRNKARTIDLAVKLKDIQRRLTHLELK